MLHTDKPYFSYPISKKKKKWVSRKGKRKEKNFYISKIRVRQFLL